MLGKEEESNPAMRNILNGWKRKPKLRRKKK
jgi:hypothetical protein